MPTFKICTLSHYKRKDNKYRVLIRLTHNRKSTYVSTDIYIQSTQLNESTLEVKDKNVLRRIDQDIISYEKLLLYNFGSNLDRFSAKELATFIKNHTATEGGANIDFIAFSRLYVAKLRINGRQGSVAKFDAVIRALIDFYSREQIFIKEITRKNLQDFADHLLSERTMIRVNQFAKEYTITRPAVKTQTASWNY